MKRHHRPPRHTGFSLVEMAVVMMIVGVLLSGLLVALGQSTESTRRTNARAQLYQLQEALYGFAQANGRLPCPATAASGGREDPVGGGDCTAYHGFVPNVTLGIYGSTNTDQLLLDPWQSPLRYSVASRDTVSGRAFTSSAGLSWLYANNNLTGESSSMLRVCEESPCSNVLADYIPAVVISMGENWATFTSANETANGGGASLGSYTVSSTNDFVSATYSEDNFDDILLWVSPYVLYSRMIQAGQLP